MSTTINPTLGELMANYGGVFIGVVEYIASIFLLAPVVYRLLKKSALVAPGKRLSEPLWLGAL